MTCILNGYSTPWAILVPNTFQSGIRPGFGTALIAFVDYLLLQEDNRVSFLLDLSAAFDTIDHGILLRQFKKSSIGMTGIVLYWF